MPDRLKSILVDDWENVTKHLQLVSVPAKKPASVILDEYYQHATGSGSRSETETDILDEVIQGLKEYFVEPSAASSFTASNGSNSSMCSRRWKTQLMTLRGKHWQTSTEESTCFACLVSEFAWLV